MRKFRSFAAVAALLLASSSAQAQYLFHPQAQCQSGNCPKAQAYAPKARTTQVAVQHRTADSNGQVWTGTDRAALESFVAARNAAIAPAPAPAQYRLVDAAGQAWTHGDPAVLSAFVAARNAGAPQARPQGPGADADGGFLGWLNATRAQHRLPAVGWDQNLANQAAVNSAEQTRRGLGHHYMGSARRQNSAMGSASSLGSMWMNSPAHRAALLDPSIRAIGLAGAGAFWTLNLQ